MHYSLIREQLLSELGAPDEIFDSFDRTAFAAASIGQVHRTRLQDGREVAIKIQYPGIARTIRSDLSSLKAMMRPFLYNENCRAVSAMFDELRTGLETETDYVQEAQNMRDMHQLFVGDDKVVIPEFIDEYSTGRVLTMSYLDGQTMDEFLSTNPPQALRDHFGTIISRALYRIYGERILYSDAHPGNFLLFPDRRLGLLDFGNLRRFADSPSVCFETTNERLLTLMGGRERG